MARAWSASLLALLLFVFGAWETSFAAAKGCNKTIRTTRAVRSPKLTRLNKKQPVTCIYHFLGYGDRRNTSLFELTVRSFNVGRQLNETSCSQGYLQIIDHKSRVDQAGYFCGRARRSRTYLAEAEVVTLVFHVDHLTRHTFFKAQSSVLPPLLARERHKELAAKNPGVPLPGTYCDRIFVNCIGFCDVMSPGYPGVYPRNATCTYRIVFNNSDARVIIGGQYFDKFDVWGAPGFTGHRIVTSCPYDYLRIQDGVRPDSPVVGKFCGRGTLPRIVARSPEVTIEFVSSAAGGMGSDGFYLSVGSERRMAEGAGQEIVSEECEWIFHSKDASQGHFFSLRHWYPPRTKCSYKFVGRHEERVWINFQGFNTRRGHRCRDKLHLYDAPWADPSSLLGTFCGRSRPNETLLSSRDSLFVQFESADGSYDGSQFEYAAYFLFVNSTPPSSVVPDTACDQVFTSGATESGTFDLLPNRLLLRRRQLRCDVHFVGRQTELVRLVLTEIKFDPVKQCARTPTSRGCTETRVNPIDHVAVRDGDGKLLECFCGDLHKVVEVTSRDSSATVHLHLYHIHYLAYRETNSFLFRGRYEFLQVGCGEAFMQGHQGELHFPLFPERLPDNIHCKWTLETNKDTHVLLKFPFIKLPANCTHGYIRVFTNWHSAPYAELCGNHTGLEILPPSWTQSSGSSSVGNTVLIELLSTDRGVSFRMLWTEIRPPEGDTCQYLCPDNRTCLTEDLVCNGVINCPEHGFAADPIDEAPSHCHPMDYVIRFLVSSLVVCVTVIVGMCIVFCLLRRRRQETRPRPK